ncbi:MAG: ABC transporter permease [Sphingobacteriia bacterium]|jgi:putative ABC transport system permease protein|nr:ABC transporter permease [Paludibacteraceae bacterium]NCA78660.1 ABC transporter permease [Sphingobacteriia bacterium]
MFDLDTWQEIWLTITRNKMRSLLTAFGVFWGVFMLVVMAGFGVGIKHGIMDGVDHFEANSTFMFTDRTSEPYKGFQRGRIWNMTMSDYEAIQAQYAHEIKYMSGVIFGDRSVTNNIVRSDKYGSFSVMGFSPDYDHINPSRMLQGRFINDIDIKERRKVCVIGKRVANDLYAPGETIIGSLLRVNGIYYTVIGVNEAISQNIRVFGDAEEMVSVPFTTLQQTQNCGDEVHCIALAANSSVNIAEMEEEIKTLLKARNNISPTDSQAVQAFNTKQIFDMFNALIIGINALIWIVGLGTLLAGIVGVSNIMLVTVRERTQEIGVRRALGASPWVILKQIMSESLVLTVLAGIGGIVLGVSVLSVISNILANSPSENIPLSNPQISFGIAIAALIIILISGLFAGWLPSKRALQIKAIDALRDE